MASRMATSLAYPDKSPPLPKDNLSEGDQSEGKYGFDYLPGSKLSDGQTFHNRRGGDMSLTPLMIDFRRLLSTKSNIPVIPGVSNCDLLHAVVGLYSVSLSEMTPEVLYATVCEKWARTIVLVRDVPETLEDLEQRKLKKKSEPEEETADDPKGPDVEKETQVNGVSEEKSKQDACAKDSEKDADGCGDGDAEPEEEEDVLQEDEPRPGKFDCVYSDTEEEESEDEDGDEDFSKGINSFLESVKKRREIREAHEGQLTPEHVGIENRLIGAGTFKKTYVKGERIIHLTLVAVRQRYRKWGVGKFILSQIKETSVVGQYDAVVVHADNGAIEFFERYGLTDDIIINSKWSDLAEQFTNCTLMCYLPPFTGQTLLSQSVPELDIIAMEKEIKKWRDKAIESYKAEMSCINRLRHEIIHLRALSSSQSDIIHSLMEDNDKLRREKFLMEKEYMNYQMKMTTSTFSEEGLGDEEDDELSAEVLIQQLRDHVRRTSMSTLRRGMSESSDDAVIADPGNYLLSQNSNSDEPYCHGQDAQDFYQITCDFKEAIKRDSSIVTDYSVKSLSKATLCPSAFEAITSHACELGDSNIAMHMYYCGSLEQPSRLEEILRQGFTAEDFSKGEFGQGLYFSKFPSKAAMFSALGHLLYVEVNLGNVETVVRKDPNRTKASDSYQSILTPGRLSAAGNGDTENQLCQEYVVFHPLQAHPLYLIEYTASG